MSARLRLLVFLAGGLLGMPLALGGLSGLPAFGTGSGALGDLILRVGLPERLATNLVSAVMFDYRGLDTLVEEFVFMAAVLGLMLLLRQRGSEAEGMPPDLPRGWPLVPRTEAVVLAGRWGAPLLALLGSRPPSTRI